MKRKYLFIVALGVAVALAACGGEEKIDPLEIGDPEWGREIYENGGGLFSNDHGCASCHSLDGLVGGQAGWGPSFQGISERAGERVPGMSAVDYLRQSILDPSAYVVEGFDDYMLKSLRFFLGEEDVDALVAFMLTQ